MLGKTRIFVVDNVFVVGFYFLSFKILNEEIKLKINHGGSLSQIFLS